MISHHFQDGEFPLEHLRVLAGQLSAQYCAAQREHVVHFPLVRSCDRISAIFCIKWLGNKGPHSMSDMTYLDMRRKEVTFKDDFYISEISEKGHLKYSLSSS